MKQRILLFLLALIFALSGCQIVPEQPTTTTTVETATTAVETTTTAPEETTTVPTTTVQTQPLHSKLYLQDVPVEDVISYFNEVCLAAEFSHNGDPSVVQRWQEPIKYTVYGSPTEEDLAVLESFTEWLNTLEGFPGIYEAAADDFVNLRIHFCTQDELLAIMGSEYTDLDGAVTFWYLDDIIYDEVICIRTELDQELRNSVILEEIYNGLGPVQDTELRPDSIIYSQFSQPQSLTDVDELILRLLYDPQIQPGMNAEACEEIIREIYY